MVKLNFVNLSHEMQTVAKRLCRILDFEISPDGIPVKTYESDKICVKLHENAAEIHYKKKNHFFRALGLFTEHARKSSSFNITEKPSFETVGVMLQSTHPAFSVENIKRYLDYLSVMGYNLVMLYTEYNFEIETEPFFGYMSGRYTADELRKCDDYAYEYGIEMIPCIQTLGHLAGFLKWPDVRYAKDTESVLLCDSEKTYELIDDIIKSASAPYRSKRIHIGMDEAWDMGRGAYLTKNGYVEPFEIFTKHLKRVVDITNKYNLKPMIWSDMFFRVNEPSQLYYEKETVIPEEIKKNIPKEVELVYWHYGEKAGCDEYMIEKHKQLGRNTIFAGGVWSWTGHFPENNYAFEMTEAALGACKKHGIKEVMTTVWGTLCGYSVLLPLSFTAEMAYTDNTSRENLKSRFETCTKGDYDAFWAMSAYHNTFDDNKKYENYHDRFAGMPLFYQDIFEGKADPVAYELKLSGHYKKYAEIMSTYHGEWEELYRYTEDIFKYLHLKCTISENLKPAYDKNDKEMLGKIANELLPALHDVTVKIHAYLTDTWLSEFKGYGERSIDSIYGGIAARTLTCRMRLNDYLDGKTAKISELEQERLPYKLNGFNKYGKIMA